ncbi:MAG: hypothetical protein V7647_1813 [Acidobacteriota bacterium]|jgi:hypothetical protein
MACRSSVLPWFFAALIAVLVNAPVDCAAEWRRLDSPNFIIVGDVAPGTLRDVAVSFEGFRETLSRVLTSRVTSTAVPTVVLVFGSDKAFTPFKPRFNGKPVELAGLFVGRGDVNYIALNEAAGTEGRRVVFHEYAHLIISNVASNMPLWLNEGLAEYYRTYQLGAGGREAVLGAAIPSHLLQLNESTLLPLQQLLAITHDSPMYNEGSRRSVFYAESWALTHMLQLGKPRRVPQLGQFLSLVTQGVSAPDAWSRAFGADNVERDLNSYIRGQVFSAYRYTFPDKIAKFEANPAPLARSEAEAFLVDFLEQQGRHDEAAERLSKLTAEGAGGWLTTISAELEVASKAYPAAEKRLLTLGTDVDWFTAYRAGVALGELVTARGDKPEPSEIAAARRLFGVATAAGRQVPNAVARLATMELDGADGPPPSIASALNDARALAPGRLDYAFLYARVLAAQSAFQPARDIVSPLMSPAYPADVRDYARSLMSYILSLQTSRTNAASANALGAASASPTGSGLPSAPSAEASADPAAPRGRNSAAADAPPSAVQPIYRELQAGEQRLEGMLERIDCGSSGVVFNVQTASGRALFTTARLDTVDFITYRTDMKGNVACGALSSAAKVYVTWRRGEHAEEHVVVAIEFLPR